MERCSRGEITGVLPSFLIGASGDTEVHIPVRDLGKSDSVWKGVGVGEPLPSCKPTDQ